MILFADALEWPAAAVIITGLLAFLGTSMPLVLQWMRQRREASEHELRHLRHTLDTHVDKDQRRWHLLFRFLTKWKQELKLQLEKWMREQEERWDKDK